MEIAALGTQEFILGFQLAGIRKTIEISDAPLKDFQQVLDDKNIGIVITDEHSMERLKEHERFRIERSVRPAFIVLSMTASGQDNLRKMIMKAIGVDLLKE
ncbi:MAG: V-type ATP synthase subunit F [Nanoarchaeota archaeon]